MTVDYYTVTNRITGVTKRYKTRAKATAASNKADNAYGAYITTIKTVWKD